MTSALEPSAGTTLCNRRVGDRLTFLSSPEDWAADRLRLRLWLPERCSWALPHYHIDVQERMRVTEGVLDLYHDGAWRPLYPEDDWVQLQPGTVHGFRNRARWPVVIEGEMTPARDVTLAILETYRLAEAGRLGPWNLPLGLRAALRVMPLHHAYSPWLPRRLQVGLFERLRRRHADA